MTPLQKVLADAITRRGPMPFAAYMAQALYHPRFGYYSAGAPRTGWHGDFLTSPELDPAFGQLWARAFEQVWESSGRPQRFEIVEVGGGEGGFAEAVLSAIGEREFGAAVSYRLVERISALEERQRNRLVRFGQVAWSASIAELPRFTTGCVFANEVLDNLPVHLVEKRNGELFEVCVVVRGDALALDLVAPSTPHLPAFLERVGIDLPEGHRMEVPLAAASFVERTAAALGRGALIFVDYGETAGELAARPAGSLLCYSNTGVDDDPLTRPGEKDITAHANWTAVGRALQASGMSAVGPIEQREVLRRLGSTELDHALRSQHADAVAARRGAAAVAALSRRQALAALTDRGGLGRLDVLVGLRGIEPPAFLVTAR